MRSNHAGHLLFIIAILLAGCQPRKSAADMQPAPSEFIPPTTLTICLGYEPESLYVYNASSLAARNVLQAILDGPIDIINGQPIPVILEKLPEFSDGSARLTSTSLKPGDLVINTEGQLVALQAGTQVFPSGCTSPACAITFDGSEPLLMDKITATYKLKPGLTWSDGQPLIAKDSVYSFKVAADRATPISKRFNEQTAVYTALDDQTIEWTSQPGVVTDAFERYFWIPLPEHAWGSFSAVELLVIEESNRKPLGWGPYMVEEWFPGKSIRLEKNPHYFRAIEGLPYFEHLIFRITDRNSDTNLANLKFDRAPFRHLNYDIGEFDEEIADNGCDLTTTTADMRDQMQVFNYLLNFYQDPAIQVFESADTETLFLLFNLGREQGEEISPQNNPELRTAISQCIDRGKIIQLLSSNLFNFPYLIDLSQVDDPMDQGDFLTYDPVSAKEELQKIGWSDHDDNKATPRISEGVDGITNGNELVMTLLVENITEFENAANMLRTMLTDCGIGFNTRLSPIEILWNPNEDNSLFRGHFDIALVSWETPIKNPCLLWASEEIPNHKNGFLGTNFSRYSNQRIDEICSLFALQRQTALEKNLLDEMQIIINREIPLIPLYSYSKLLTAQKDLCSVGLIQGNENELSGIEEFQISSDCL